MLMGSHPSHDPALVGTVLGLSVPGHSLSLSTGATILC